MVISEQPTMMPENSDCAGHISASVTSAQHPSVDTTESNQGMNVSKASGMRKGKMTKRR